MSSMSINLTHEPQADGRKFRYGFITDEGPTEMVETQYQGDIFIVLMDVFGCEDFAFEMDCWCDNAKPGDKYKDEDVIIECL